MNRVSHLRVQPESCIKLHGFPRAHVESSHRMRPERAGILWAVGRLIDSKANWKSPLRAAFHMVSGAG